MRGFLLHIISSPGMMGRMKIPTLVLLAASTTVTKKGHPSAIGVASHVTPKGVIGDGKYTHTHVGNIDTHFKVL